MTYLELQTERRKSERLSALQKHRLTFAFLWTVSVLVAWRPLVDTFALAWRNDDYTHILLILPVSILLVFLERRSLGSRIAFDFRISPALLIAAAGIAAGARFGASSLPADVQLTIEMLALVLSWIGISVLCLGSRAARAVLFPLLFLIGLVPLPQVALDGIIMLLQWGSAWSAHALFALCAIPVAQAGVTLRIPDLTIQIAQDCSSIRSSSMLLVTTMVLAQVLLRSPWRKSLVIALAIPLSVAKNGLRIFTIAMLGTRVDPAYLNGRFHRQGGILFFIVALMAIFAALLICQRGENGSHAADLNLTESSVPGD